MDNIEKSHIADEKKIISASKTVIRTIDSLTV